MVYKQLVLNGTLFLYNFFNGMSGTSLYDSVMIIAYSTLYTFFPVLAVGCFDQSARATTLYEYPQGYFYGQTNCGFSLRVVGVWAADAAMHAVLIFFLTMSSWSASGGGLTAGSVRADGHDSSVLVLGTQLHLMLILVCNLKLVLCTNMHSRFQLLVMLVCVLLWFGIELCWDRVQRFLHMTIGLTSNSAYHGVFVSAVTSPTFWLTVPLVSVASMLLDVACQAYRIASNPTMMDAIRSLERHLLAEASLTSEGALERTPRWSRWLPTPHTCLRSLCCGRVSRFKAAIVVPTSHSSVP